MINTWIETPMNIFDIVLVIFAAIAAFNIFAGFTFTIEKIIENFGSKSKKWVYIYVIATSLGIFALKTIIERS